MSKHNPENTDSSSSNTPGWLRELRPASASSLQASVFYQAGYEAARHELGKTAWRRASIVAIAASVFMASVSGVLLFQLGKQSGQTIAVSKQDLNAKPIDAPEIVRQLPLASATSKLESTVEAGPSLIPSWFQWHFSRKLPIANTRVTFLGPGVELGRIGAELDKVIVISNDSSALSTTNSSAEKSQSTERQTLRTMRDNQIKSLMESLL